MLKLPREIIAGLPTKSAQIRALDTNGYAKTDIARLLGISYQHVYNVLTQSGTVKKKSPNDHENLDDKTEKWSEDRLLSAGFELIGCCILNGTDEFSYSDQAPKSPGVYAFSVNNLIHYVGLTRASLRGRLGHYVYGHEQQRTSARVKRLIVSALNAGDAVRVLIAVPPQLEWNGLPVDGASGLETGLIGLIRPVWNVQLNARASTAS
jgi:hypothetical protein